MKYGYHMGISKSFNKSIKKEFDTSMDINAYQIFMKTPRRKILSKITDEDAIECKKFIEKNDIYLVAHSSYLLNIATEIIDDNDHTLLSALDDMITIEKIGGVGAIFHVGKHLKRDEIKCLDNMYNFIIKVVDITSDSVTGSKFILETAAGCGTELCTTIQSLGKFYNRFSNEYKKRIKICIDTCHIFSAGHDIKTSESAIKFITDVEENIGWKNVEVIHLNDSKKDLGCHVDRHENLCEGFIGKKCDSGFREIIKKCNQNNIPIILETPDNMLRKNDINLISHWLSQILT